MKTTQWEIRYLKEVKMTVHLECLRQKIKRYKYKCLMNKPHDIKVTNGMNINIYVTLYMRDEYIFAFFFGLD